MNQTQTNADIIYKYNGHLEVYRKVMMCIASFQFFYYTKFIFKVTAFRSVKVDISITLLMALLIKSSAFEKIRNKMVLCSLINVSVSLIVF